MMLDVSANMTSLRKVTAQAIIRTSKQQTIDAFTNKLLEKDDVVEVSRMAGKLAVKQTAMVIPNCHPLLLDHVDISYNANQLDIQVQVCVKAVTKIGMDSEAIYGASVVAVTIYDMLKDLDKDLEIISIRLLEKSGSSADFYQNPRGIKVGLIISSDAIVQGKKENKSGRIIKEKLETIGLEISDESVLPNQKEVLQEKIKSIYKTVNLLIIAGGTGFLPRDITPETVRPLLDKEIPGIAEAARNYGQDRTPLAMLSRSLAGVIGETLVLVIPGSSRGTKETMDALFPYVLHTFKFRNIRI